MEQPPEHIMCIMIPVRVVKKENEDGEKEWKFEEVEDPGWEVETKDPYTDEVLALRKERGRRRSAAVQQSSSSRK
eukprot:2498465-Rhodomonas_salina.1